ncbi:MAG: sulfatase [Draconibacterium sp.]|nr:sulfatase [Draconibacterium sp.]
MKPITILILLIFTATCNSLGNGKKQKTPNVVFIICDDLNDAVHGMGGHPQAKTPNLDKLIEKGVRFTNAQTNCPLCGPSRASLWSGLYPHTTGFFGYSQQQNHWRKNHVLKNTVTLFEHLSGNGYNVYATGKIHHNGHEDYSIFENEDGSSGFKVKDSFGPYPWDGDPEKIAEKIRGITHPDMLPYLQNLRWSKSFGPIRNISNDVEGGTWLYTHWGEEFKINNQNERDLTPDERSAEYAVEVIEKNHEKPFFLAVGFNRPHTPLYAPQKYFDMFPLESLRLAPNLENDLDDCAKSLKGKTDFMAAGFGSYKMYNEAGGKELLLKWTQAYLACVASVDEQIGKVVEAIQNSEHADNTLIIVTSDHGYHMGEKEYIFKNTLWEESARIPLIISGLESAHGKECTNPVSLIDIYPTVADICQLPENPNKGGNEKKLDGYSLKPLYENPESGNWKGNDFAITAVASNEKLEVNEPGKINQQHYSIRTERYRYILCRNGEEELYDHYYDPYEWNNLANDPLYKKVKKEMKQKAPYKATN